MPEADTSQKDYDIDLAGDQSVSKVDSDTVLFKWCFAHRRAYMRDTAMPLDQPSHLSGLSTLESGNAETLEIRRTGVHQVNAT